MTRRDAPHAGFLRHGLRQGLTLFRTLLSLLAGFWRFLVWVFLFVYFSFIGLVLVLRYSILPNIEAYRPKLEQLASQSLGQNVSIGRIEASWEGINPDLSLIDVRVADAEGRPALAFSRIEAILSWWSVPSYRLKLGLLRIEEPTLNLRRDPAGRYFVAGIPISSDTNDNNVAEWILSQKRIRISGATLVWEDELRKAPALVLENLNFGLDNSGRSHRFGLTALPLPEMASKLDLRGDLVGSALDPLAAWTGQAYAQVDYADLAIWRQWVDYPIALPYGKGAMRAWLGFENGGLRRITTDVSLQNVNLRLAQNLPSIELERLSGRLSADFPASGFAVTGHDVALSGRPLTNLRNPERESIEIAPTDFKVDWHPETKTPWFVGNGSANQLDVGALAKLAEYVPFDTQTRRLLKEYAPQGRITDLRVKWKGNAEQLQNYSINVGFETLALRAQGYFPGFSGLSGGLEANEKGGSVSLRSKASSIDLPSVFPESLISLDALNAQAKWKIDQGVLEAQLSHAEFAGPDAAGVAQGVYRNNGDGPGLIDLTASLSRGKATAVWRYMPHAVGEGARYWLRDSLLAGNATEAKLILKGNLLDFPFLDKSRGQFLVTVKARDAVLDYGKGWPRIEGIAGDLRFEGPGMSIDAQRGSILGAQLSKTQVEIPDFDAPVPDLFIKGHAEGPTAEFLKFIEQSPVGARIDHFTEDMRATGRGVLELGLQIPLSEERLGSSKINGTYRFENNEIIVDTAIPPLKLVTGSVQFTDKDMRVPEINASLFGGPLKIKGGVQKDGKVLITANGSVDVAQLRKLSDSPLLANLSGVTPYRGEVRINKRTADLVVDSTLLGLSSKFPEPFGKTASDPLALHFEKKFLPLDAPKADVKVDATVRDQISVSLGNVATMQLVRRKQDDAFVIERGAVGVGQAIQLPERGLSLGVTTKQLDFDRWEDVLRAGNGNAVAGNVPAASPTSSSFLPEAIHIKAADLLLLGRRYQDVDFNATTSPEQWKIRLSSRQASGDLQWDTAGRGKLMARLRHLNLDPARDVVDAGATETTKELPALDIVAEDFSIGARRFGRLELQARNEGPLWHLSKIQASNPFGNITGSGQWMTRSGRNRTQLDFKIDSSDVGKLLDQLGYPNTVRAGTAQFGGKVGWNGTPTDLDYDSLSGDMTLEAGKGQFVKLNPGAAGKLLGLISLQGLPRRISLDFKDVFSEGFAFDSIASKISIQNGLMSTDRLQIDGPSARVVMRGEVDLKHETQRLNVNVQPELGGTAALGVALINPLAGVATWVVHKALQNPLNQLFGFDYLITGKWDDPKVEKLSGNAPTPVIPEASPTPRLPTIPNSEETPVEPAPQ